METHGSGDGQRAAGDGPPQAVILDAMLANRESGLEVARQLLDYLPAERILIVTGNVDHEHLARIEDAGLEVMPEPVPAAQLAAWRAALPAPPPSHGAPRVSEAGHRSELVSQSRL